MFGGEQNKRPPLPFNWDGEQKKENGTQHVSDDSGVCVYVCLSKRLTHTLYCIGLAYSKR